MFCHPKRIRSYPEFELFKDLIRYKHRLNAEMHTVGKKKNKEEWIQIKKMLKKVEKELKKMEEKGICEVSNKCNENCPYYEECLLEVKDIFRE
ncbi:MAG: hypothetical protein D6834_01645 [Aquificota bacterium]|nr:MAG: hypothetical protein D6834_01645 [Aquificota bacterium]